MLAPRSSTLPAREWRMPGGLGLWVGVLASGSLVLLLVLPLVALLGSAPLSTLASAAASPGLDAALVFTLFASALSLGVVLGLGVPLGFLLARYRFPGRSVLESVVTLPIVLPHLVGGLALLLLFSPQTPLGALAVRAGLPVVGTIWGTVLVMVYVSASYTVLASQVAFQGVDQRLVEAARSLGAAPSEAFASITLPLAARGILSGALLSWARSVSEIGGFLILSATVYPAPPYSGPVTSPVSVYIYNLYQLGDVPGAAAGASILVLLAFVIFLVVRLAARRGTGLWQKIFSGRWQD
jgi:molybdate/tungstate transport system permease protein